jgi:hypothetical protein
MFAEAVERFGRKRKMFESREGQGKHHSSVSCPETCSSDEFAAAAAAVVVVAAAAVVVAAADWLLVVAEPCSSIWERFRNHPVAAEPCLFSLLHSDYFQCCPVVRTCTGLEMERLQQEMDSDQMVNE